MTWRKSGVRVPYCPPLSGRRLVACPDFSFVKKNPNFAFWLVRLGSAIWEDELRDARAHARCSVAVAPCESLIAHHVETRRILQIRQLSLSYLLLICFSFIKSYSRLFESFFDVIVSFSGSNDKPREQSRVIKRDL